MVLTLLMQLGQYHTPMGVACTRGNRHKGWYTRSHPLQNSSSSGLLSLPHSSQTSGFTRGSQGNEGGWAESWGSVFIVGEGELPYSHSIESSIGAGHILSDHTHIINYQRIITILPFSFFPKHVLVDRFKGAKEFFTPGDTKANFLNSGLSLLSSNA